MCGIAGIFSGDERPMDVDLLQAMTAALAHRGPDDASWHVEPGLALGFRRLSIVDLAGGSQPICNEDRSIVMICNGEIYDYSELRRRLEVRGHAMRAAVDVEVLVHLYEERGDDFLDDVNGQFALALFDRRRRRLLLARDPMGIAPLFYAHGDGVLAFASEIMGLRAHPLGKGGVDLTGLDQVLTLPGPVSPRTLFTGVQSLPPGHLLVAQDAAVRTRAYWDLDFPAAADVDPGREPDLDELDARLRRAVARRLRADVPVGFYLSGGLDSSLVAAMIGAADSAVGGTPVRHAFSIGFKQPRIDERRFQEMVARKFGAEHHVEVFGVGSIEQRLRQAVLHAAAPLKESYNTCSLALSASVRAQGLKVVLTGEGADELFGGYVGYRMQSCASLELSDDLDEASEAETRTRMWGDAGFRYEKSYTAFAEVKSALYAPALADDLARFDCCRQPVVDRSRVRGRHPQHQRSYIDLKVRLADHLLADHGDRVCYAHSIEARYPYLDPEVVDWVRNAPPGCMVRDGREKYPLRRVAERYLPTAITRREKFGFVAPSCAALLQSGVAWVDDMLSYARIRAGGYFNADTIERLKHAYRSPGFDLNTTFETDLLMIVLTFELLRDCYSIPPL